MKKTVSLILAIVMCLSLCLSLCACGGSSGGSGNKCYICKKPATHTFQGTKYCDSCYEDAVKWAFDNVAGK